MVCLFQLGKQVDGMTVIIDMDQAGASMLWGPGEKKYSVCCQLQHDYQCLFHEVNLHC